MELIINTEDCELLKTLLNKEERDTQTEIHHCRTREYKDMLKRRKKHLRSLMERIAEADLQGPRPGHLERPPYRETGLGR